MPRVEAFAPFQPFSPATPRTPSTLHSDNAAQDFGMRHAQLYADIGTRIRDGFGVRAAGGPGNRMPVSSASVAPARVDATGRHRFLDRIAPWAREAARQLGLSEDLIVAHAALESGWGQRTAGASGRASSHNLFGIKAGVGWPGDAVDAITDEFIAGAMRPLRQRFRVYANEADAVGDYTRLLQSPRYAAARGVGADAAAFARGLVQGGYATDPAYARKLERMVAQVRGLRGVDAD